MSQSIPIMARQCMYGILHEGNTSRACSRVDGGTLLPSNCTHINSSLPPTYLSPSINDPTMEQREYAL
jgi:hypothetical protein